MQTFLGIDFGGTKLLIGEIDSHGRILSQKRYNTGYVNQQAAIDLIKASLGDFLRTVGTPGRIPAAVGIGMIGRVDTRSGRWLQIDINRSHPIELAREIHTTFGLPCYMANDVKSATIAEQCWGYGRYTDNFVYINVGTGIAAGIVTDGRIVTGSHFNAGEVGHTQVGIHTGVQCCCGRTDCVEAIASGSGFDACARLLAPEYPDTALRLDGLNGRVDVRHVYELARKGDTLCCLLVENAAKALANLIMNLVRVSDPDTVVLGGGIVSDPFMFDRVLSYLHSHTMRFVKNGVVTTMLDPAHAGLLGAAAVAMRQNSKQLQTV